MTDYLLQFFSYEHLPANLQVISKPFGDVARNMVATLPSNPERSAGLRKLLEAKDCAVRAAIFKPLPKPTVAELEKILQQPDPPGGETTFNLDSGKTPE